MAAKAEQNEFMYLHHLTASVKIYGRSGVSSLKIIKIL